MDIFQHATFSRSFIRSFYRLSACNLVPSARNFPLFISTFFIHVMLDFKGIHEAFSVLVKKSSKKDIEQIRPSHKAAPVSSAGPTRLDSMKEPYAMYIQALLMTRNFVPIALALATLLACNQPISTDLHHPKIAAVLQIAAVDAHYQRYQQLQQGEVIFEQEQWTRIETLDSLKGYHHLEVYNIYESDSGSTEYYVSEFTLLIDTLSRQLISDYQVIVNKDTAYILASEQNDFRLSETYHLQLAGQSFEVYKLLGYAHPSDQQAVHYKFWNPKLGTLMITSGGGESLELVEGKLASEVLAALIKNLKEEMKVKRF